jgi:hypothetical protein
VALVAMTGAGFKSLEKRMGDLRLFNDSGNFNGLWTRGYYQQTKISFFRLPTLLHIKPDLFYDII